LPRSGAPVFRRMYDPPPMTNVLSSFASWAAVVFLALAAFSSSMPVQSTSRVAPTAAQAREARPEELTPGSSENQLELSTSDGNLAAAFAWARHQAPAYAFSGDPVGDWYEAALPGREAFCMRDVSHQAMGAHALGLAPHTRNMLGKFAANISDSKDWCSYWEINRYGRPAPVDYQNDARFWYDLPANFDVLDACYRMYLWTGDLRYVEDPQFLVFYDRTVSDYVERWALGLDRVMKRERIMNIRGEFNPRDKFQISRGIPGYEEGQKNYAVGIDLLAAQYAAYRAYSRIQGLRGNFESAGVYASKARALREFVNRTWFDSKTNHFYALLDENHQLQGQSAIDVLYYGIGEDGPKAQAALNDLAAAIKANPSGQVELESHYAEVLYRYGMPDLAYAEIMDLARKGRERQEYPEVSFSVVGAIVTGLMGINIQAPSPEQSALEWDFVGAAAVTRDALQLGIAPPVAWNYVEVVIKSLPSLANPTAWAEIRNVPIRANKISVRHDGNGKTTLTNESGPALIWHASFRGAYSTLLVNGRPVKASSEKEALGLASFVELPVGPGNSVVVEIPAAAAHS
jgi:hypothetical protein